MQERLDRSDRVIESIWHLRGSTKLPHETSDAVIMDPRPQGARVRCFFQILQWNADYQTNFVFGIGTRDDRLIKEDGRWVFARLTVNAWTAVDQVPWKGERTLPMRPPYKSEPADTRPFDEQTGDGW